MGSPAPPDRPKRRDDRATQFGKVGGTLRDLAKMLERVVADHQLDGLIGGDGGQHPGEALAGLRMATQDKRGLVKILGMPTRIRRGIAGRGQGRQQRLAFGVIEVGPAGAQQFQAATRSRAGRQAEDVAQLGPQLGRRRIARRCGAQRRQRLRHSHRRDPVSGRAPMIQIDDSRSAYKGRGAGAGASNAGRWQTCDSWLGFR